MGVEFGKKLKSLRKSAEFTQKQIAQKLNVVESCYANWEQGRTEPDIESIIKLKEIFDCTFEDLFL